MERADATSCVRADPFWDPTLFLTVVLGFGELDFPAARAIDFCWDLVAGRGGQLLLAIATYRIVRKSLLLTIERDALSLPAFTTLSTQGITLATFWRMIRSSRTVNQGRSMRSRVAFVAKWRFVAIVFACCYVLLFTSVVSIMTGYQAGLAPFVKSPGDTSLVPTDETWLPAIILRDGHRVGLHDNYPLWRSLEGQPKPRADIDYALLFCKFARELYMHCDAELTCRSRLSESCEYHKGAAMGSQHARRGIQHGKPWEASRLRLLIRGPSLLEYHHGQHVNLARRDLGPFASIVFHGAIRSSFGRVRGHLYGSCRRIQRSLRR